MGFKKIFLTGLCLLSINPVFSHQRKTNKKISAREKKLDSNRFIVMTGRPKAGLFATLNFVCMLLSRYKAGNYRGIEVDFGTTGLYYEPKYGKNWWNYYFEPVCFGKKINIKKVVDVPYLDPHTDLHKKKPPIRQTMFGMIQKYFHIKPHILDKINTFDKENFKDYFVISVHYRGTDKIKEAPRLPYEKIPEAVLDIMKSHGDKKYKIFVATDEQAFVDYMITLFGDLVCYKKDALRSTSGQPIHFDKNFNHYKSGEDALVDCLLLSRGNFLIRTSSNLSRWATYFNPNLPSIELSSPYGRRNNNHKF